MNTTPQGQVPEALIEIAREIEALKRPCGMDPESSIAVQNGRYMSLSYKVRALAAQVSAVESNTAGAVLPAPESYGTRNGRIDPGQPLFAADDVRDFGNQQFNAGREFEAARRASHGQAPVQPATVHCKGRNCAAVDGDGHSDECASDHERAASGLDTAGNRNPIARYDGYRGVPCNTAYTKDQQAAWLEGYEARNRQVITPSPQAAQQAVEGGDVVDAARYRYLRDVHIGDCPESINLPPAGKRGLDAAVDMGIKRHAARAAQKEGE